MIGEGLARPAPLRLSRRRLLLGLGAGAAAAPLSGCDAGSPAALSVLDKAEALTKAVQRALLAPRTALAPESPPGAITPTFKPNGSIMPDSDDYQAAMANNFADWRLKIDGLVQVGHACVVGEDNIICAQTGLAGGSILEKNVLLAGQVGISGHLTIHDNAVIYAQSGIGGDVPAGALMSGSPAFEAREWLRAITAFPKLPDLLKTVRQLEKRLERLEGATPSQ